jgi:uncharacterized protein YndB with AHSA1/START domain
MPKPRGEPAVSEEALIAKTGRGWAEWFAILDGWGAPEKGHKQTARYLAETWEVSAWWAQTITVRFERERGLRLFGQRSEGTFTVSVQRTLRATPDQAFDALTHPDVLSRWFTRSAQADLRVGGRYANADGDQGEFVIFDRPQRLRFTWDNPEHCPKTLVEVVLTEKPGGRVAVRLEHSRIKTQAGFQDMKEGWTWAMDSLKSYLETGKPLPQP